MDAPRQLTERDERAVEIADLVFVRLANVENEKVLAAIEPGLEFTRGDFRDPKVGNGSLFTPNATEFVIIDKLVDRAMLTAHRAIWVFAELQLAKFHRQGIE